MSPIRRVQDFPRPEFKTIEEANEWAKELTDALHEDTTLRSYDIDSAITTTAHNHAASDINSGTLVHERGGLEADVNAYSGYIKITGGTTSNPNAATIKTDLSLNLVENTALSSWAGTTNVTTLGTIATGTWNGSDIDTAYITAEARVRAYPGSDQLNIANGTWTVVQCDTESYDTGADFDTGAYKFVVPITGYYLAMGSIQWGGITADKRYGVGIYVDTTEKVACIRAFANTDLQEVTCSDIIYLTASDDVYLKCIHDVGAATPDVKGGVDSRTFMAIHLIST